MVYAAGTSIEVFFHPLRYYVDGVEKLPVSGKQGFVYQETTYVPLRFVAESLGKEVVWDGKTNSIYIGEKPEGNIAITKDVPNYENGTYRGMFADRGEIQVVVEFKLSNNIVTDISFRQLYYGKTDYRTESENQTIIGLRGQYEELAKYLVGKDIRVSLQDLYTPGNIVKENVDTFTGATLRAGKVISATKDALNRGVYSY